MEQPLDWYQLLITPVLDIGRSVVTFLPNLISAFFIMAMGVAAALLVQVFLRAFLRSVGFDRFSKSIRLLPDEESRPPHQYVATVVYWLIVVSVAVMALERLKLRNVSFQIDMIVGYTIAVLVVAVVGMAGLFLSMLVHRVIRGAAASAGYAKPDLLADGAKWVVLISTALACMFHIGVPREILLMVLGVTYVTLCITFVLAFGVGGTGFASSLLNRLLDKK